MRSISIIITAFALTAAAGYVLLRTDPSLAPLVAPAAAPAAASAPPAAAPAVEPTKVAEVAEPEPSVAPDPQPTPHPTPVKKLAKAEPPELEAEPAEREDGPEAIAVADTPPTEPEVLPPVVPIVRPLPPRVDAPPMVADERLLALTAPGSAPPIGAAPSIDQAERSRRLLQIDADLQAILGGQ